VLALAVTVIEVVLIVSLMITGGVTTEALARDTIFAAVMIILNGIVGLCLLAVLAADADTHAPKPSGRLTAVSALLLLVALVGGDLADHPAVAIVTLLAGWNLVLGFDAKSTVLQGAVHLVIFAVYPVTTILPWRQGRSNPSAAGSPSAAGLPACPTAPARRLRATGCRGPDRAP